MVMRMVVDLTWSGASGSPGVNVWHMRSDGELDSVDDLTNAVRDFYTSIRDYFPATVTIAWDGVMIDGIEGDSPSFGSGPAWSVTGNGSSFYLPPANAIVVGWGTESATRSGRGRTFLGPLVQGAAAADGSPDTTVLNAIRTAATNLVATSTGFANGALGVWSPTDNILRDFVSTRTLDRFAVLRSRRD